MHFNFSPVLRRSCGTLFLNSFAKFSSLGLKISLTLLKVSIPSLSSSYLLMTSLALSSSILRPQLLYAEIILSGPKFCWRSLGGLKSLNATIALKSMQSTSNYIFIVSRSFSSWYYCLSILTKKSSSNPIIGDLYPLLNWLNLSTSS